MRCYLSYTYGQNIRIIKNILNENQIEVEDFIDLKSGQLLIDGISDKIERSDFVFAVYDDNPNISFEIGIAYKSKKPIFLILPEEIDNFPSPSYLNGTTYTYTTLQDYNKINYNLQLFLKQIPTKLKSKKKTDTKKKKSNLLPKTYLNTLNQIKRLNEKEFETYVSNIFQALKIDAFAQNVENNNEIRADLALWLDDVNSLIGNPILVEIKKTNSPRILRKAIKILSTSVQKYNSKCALLIYDDSDGSALPQIYSKDQYVLLTGIQNFIEKLTKNNLSNVLAELRNENIHSLWQTTQKEK